jgi:putative acetyltransferase
VIVRESHPSDHSSLLAVHQVAFGSDIEADLVAALIDAADAAPLISAVAELEGRVVAHVLLTSGHAPGHEDLSVQLLAPLAVHPDHQNRGIGTQLTRWALDRSRDAGTDVVCVLGHPTYYPRFGFRPLLPRGPLPMVDPAPEHTDAWMTLLLQSSAESALDGVRLTWASPLADPQLWGPD